MAFGRPAGSQWSPSGQYGVGTMMRPLPLSRNDLGQTGWQVPGGNFIPSGPGAIGQIQSLGGIWDQATGGVTMPYSYGDIQQDISSSQTSQQDIDAMIKAALDPFMQQMRDYQTGLADMYQQQRPGPFDFLNAPMTFNQPQNGRFMRPSYGAPVDRGFNPGGYPSFSAPPVPSTVQGLGGMFFDPYLATLAETLFGGASWLPEPMESKPGSGPWGFLDGASGGNWWDPFSGGAPATVRPPSLKMPSMGSIGTVNV